MSVVNDLQGDIENLTAELERVKALGLDEVDRRLREEAAHAETKARLEKLREALQHCVHRSHEHRPCEIIKDALAATAPKSPFEKDGEQPPSFVIPKDGE